MTATSVTIILPTFNERDTIVPLISEIVRSLDRPAQVLVVDDDSPDRTWALVEQLQLAVPGLVLHRRRDIRGLATAVKLGVEKADGDILAWMDCDFSHPPAALPRMLERLRHSDGVILSRYVEGGRQESPLLRRLTSRLFNLFANAWLGFAIKDWTSGCIAIRGDVIRNLGVEPLGTGYGEYFIGLLYRALRKGYTIEEIPYTYVYNRTHGTKTSPNMVKLLSLGISYGLTVLRLRWRTIRRTL